MFRGYMPALTVAVFAIGLGMGFSWTRGYIPLSLSPAKSGSLAPEVLQQEPLPPPNEMVSATKAKRPETTTDDPAIFEEQTEPDVDTSVAVSTNTAKQQNVARTRPPSAVEEATSESAEQVDPPEAVPQPAEKATPLRIRNRNVEIAEPEPASARSRTSTSEGREKSHERKPVTQVAHQDPTDSASDTSSNRGASPRELLQQADEKLEAGEPLAAHRILSKIYWNHKDLRPQIQDKIDSTAKTIFFQSQPQFVEPYVVQSGDRLEVIAKKYQLTWEYLAKLNRTEPKRIQVGQKLKVVKGPFSAVVDLKDFNLTIHLQGYYVKRYLVCTGKDDCSPVGKFAVLNKVENPAYTDPDGKVIAPDDPSNPLGERWMDLGDSYGIHGTIDPDSIGKAESRGCIRLADRDVIEVYNFLVKGSEVVIRK